jgi:hypothetical protein
MRKDVREFIRRLEAADLTVESTPGHYNVLRDDKPLRKANGMPFTLPFSPDTTLAQDSDHRPTQARHPRLTARPALVLKPLRELSRGQCPRAAAARWRGW